MGHQVFKKKRQAVATIVQVDQFNGFPTFQLWEVDENNEATDQKPLVNLSPKKVKALIAHWEEFKAHAEGLMK